MLCAFITNVFVFIDFAQYYPLIDNKGTKKLGGDNMKAFFLSLIEKIEQYGEFLPFDISEPVQNHSQK